MFNLSGYDSEAVGFDSKTNEKRSEISCSTQTCNFSESGVSSQTNLTAECGTMATPEDLNAQDAILKEYPPPGLNEFLRRVVPAMMEQLDENDKEIYGSSDSDEEETLVAKLFQEIRVDSNGAGDRAAAVLDLSWSSAGNSLAVSTGKTQHEDWCTHDGSIRIYTVKRTHGDKLVHSMDITEKNCVSVVKYHTSVPAILAYGTMSGEVVICNLTDSTNKTQLTSPAGCHGSKRVSALLWADAPLANTYLTMQIKRTGKRRGASDQILISSASDGTLNVWQVNASLRSFENVVCYDVNGTRKLPAPDITCFDFIKASPLRSSDNRCPDDVFVVGTKTGTLFLCRIKSPEVEDLEKLDPVTEVLEGHRTCVLNVAFSFQRPEIFISASIDSELRVYDINQACPLKVFQMESPVSCVSWLPTNPCVAVLGLTRGAMLYDVRSGRRVPVEGLGAGASTALALNQSGTCRLAVGDADGTVRVWELPSRRIRFTPDDLCF